MDALVELNHFCDTMTQYKKTVRRYLSLLVPDSATEASIPSLRTELQQSYSRLESKISRYGGSSSVADPIFGRRQNVFDIAFGPIGPLNFSERLNALDEAIEIVNRAIGKLQAEGESWNAPVSNMKDGSKKPKAFISHSGITDALRRLRDFLIDLGIEPLLVVEQPNLGRSIDKKVEDCMDEADLAIFLATGGASDRDGGTSAGGNLLHEIGLAQAKPKLQGRIVYLKEKGTEFPSNIRTKGYIEFGGGGIEQVFGAVASEIRQMGF